MRLRLIFFGTPPIAAKALTYLIENGCEVCAVVTKPDKAKGRSGTPTPTPVKQVAMQYSLPFFQPEKASDPVFAQALTEFKADLFVVVAYGEILKENILNMPPLGCINLHASLLPKYRGAAPMQRAIMEGEKESGVTIIRMVRKMDAGALIKRQKISIEPNDTAAHLEEKIGSIGSHLLLQVLFEFEKGSIIEEVQDESLVTFAPKIELEDCEIDWSRPAQEIHNLIRGANPHPGAWCRVRVKGETKRLKILESQLEEGLGNPGVILSCTSKGGLVLACGRGALRLLQVQLEGKRAMSAFDLTRGTTLEFT